MNDVYVVSACRTPIGDFMGSLSPVTDVELGTIVAKEAIERTKIKPEDVEEVTCGLVYKGGSKSNPARQIEYAIRTKPSSIEDRKSVV